MIYESKPLLSRGKQHMLRQAQMTGENEDLLVCAP